MRLSLALIALLWAATAHAGTLYIDTAANGSASALFSGSTDTTSTKAGTGAGTATITCSATEYTGSLPGCSFSGSPDLSQVIATPGPTQDSVYIGCSTLTNQKIVWIIAVDDAADKVETATIAQTAAAPTGCTAATAVWNIGGRHVLTNATVEGALRAGDTAIFNISPAAQAASTWTFRIAGDTTSGYATIKGKVGVRPILSSSNSGAATVVANVSLVRVSNFELKQVHATVGSCLSSSSSGTGLLVDNVKCSTAPVVGMTVGASTRFLNVEVTGAGTDCLNDTGSGAVFLGGSYLHDCGGDGFEANQAGALTSIADTVIDTNGGRGIYYSGAPTTPGLHRVSNATVYSNGDSGLEVVDADSAVTIVNSIFTENGNAANEYNIEYAAGSIEYNGYHAYNDFWCTGLAANVCTSGAGNVSGLTVNSFVAASEILVDPTMTDPANGNFTIPVASPANGTGFPGQLLGATGLGYMSMGAEQVQATSSAGAHSLIIGGP